MVEVYVISNWIGAVHQGWSVYIYGHNKLKIQTMIQRIQTIFLFLAAGCGFGILAAPFATTPNPVQGSVLFSDAQFNTGDNIGLLVLFAVAGALSLASIFLFKNRPTQLKLTRFALVSVGVGLALAVILFWQDSATLASVPVNDGAGAYLPLGFIIFGILALRFIKKDENLVKSMDRLR
jgi:hypothetical protein